MRVKRSAILVLAALLVLLAGCGRVSTPLVEKDASEPPAVATHELAWIVQEVDVLRSALGRLSIALDADGSPHVAYYATTPGETGYEIWYAYLHEDGVWQTESVGDTVGVAHGSLALDGSGRPHVAYVAENPSATAQELVHVTRTDGVWSAPEVVVTYPAAPLSTLVDASDATHIGYTTQASSLMDAFRPAAGGWSLTLVASEAQSGILALDPLGRPHALYANAHYVSPYPSFALTYAFPDGIGGWVSETVDGTSNSGHAASLAFDGDGRAHVGYVTPAGQLSYASRGSDGWTAPQHVVAVEPSKPRPPSIAVDGDGNPHIAFIGLDDASRNVLGYASYVDGWTVGTVGGVTAGNSDAVALALDASGHPHIAFFDGEHLTYATLADPVAGYVVSNGNDAGEGSLRQMVLDAPAGATITFASDVSVVTLESGSLELTQDVTIAGPEGGTVTIQGDEGFAYTVVRVPVAGVDVVLRNLTITGGQADGTYAYGGGIRVDWPGGWSMPQSEPPSLRLERCTVSGNTAGEGGGLYVEGNLTIDASTVSGNTAEATGGGIEYTGTDLDETWTYTASATIRNSTLSGNVARQGGAALYNLSGDVTVLFTTITGNAAPNAGQGGGIYSSEDAATRTRMKGTIAVGNTNFFSDPDDVSGGGTNLHYESLGYNLIGAGTSRVDFDVQFRAPGDLTGVADAGLATLAANGGPTLTHALAATSLAIGRVPPEACVDPTSAIVGSDQRGEARPYGTNCDAGAVESTESITSYFLDVTASPTEGGSVSGADTYAAGTTADLTATPASHWHLVDWRGDAAGTDASVTVAMDGNKWATATFAPDLYLVQTAIDPVGAGSVLRDPAPADGLYPYGATLTLDPVAAEGYAFSYWNTDPDANADPWTVTVTGATTYTAHFVQLHELTLETLPIDCVGCAVVANPTLAAYRDGAIVVLTAVPATGWSFVEWAGVDAANGTTATVQMTADKTVTATFAQSLFTVTTGTVGQGTVKVSPDQDAYPVGTMVTLTAEPAADWRFDHWNDDAAWTGNPTVIEVSGNMDMTAHFVQTVAFVPTVEGDGVVNVEPQGPYDIGQLVTVTAIVAEGSFFQTWTGDLAGAPNPATLVIGEGTSAGAVFQPIVGPMVRVALEGDGYVMSEPAGIDCHASGPSVCVASFPRNTKLTLTAVAADGASFLRWTGTATGIEPDLNLRLREDVTVTAYFVALNGAEVAIDPMGSFRGNTAVVTGSLVCASGSYALDVSISQVVPVKKGDPVTITAATTVDAVCGQPWTATLVAADGRFVRGEAVVTVIVDGKTRTRTIELR